MFDLQNNHLTRYVCIFSTFSYLFTPCRHLPADFEFGPPIRRWLHCYLRHRRFTILFVGCHICPSCCTGKSNLHSHFICYLIVSKCVPLFSKTSAFLRIKMSGRQMKYPYTLTAKIGQFPWKHHFTGHWLYKYYAFGIFATFPVYLWLNKQGKLISFL